MKTTDSSLIEDLTIQPVPEERRTGTARHLFSVWFGVQIMPLTLVMGVLGPTVSTRHRLDNCRDRPR